MGEPVTMEGEFAYEDFDLLIEPGAQGKYRARVVRSPAGESAPVQFSVPFSALELENLVLKVGLARRRTRGPGRPESAPLKDFGGRLYYAVFQDQLRDVLVRSLSQTRSRRVGLRLRLRLTDTPELAELPWEFLYDPRLSRFLAQSRHTPLVRYLDLPDPPRPLTVEGQLRLLVMISSPAGYPELDAGREWNLLTGALAQQVEQGQVIVERLPATMSALRRWLRQERCHIFHFVGHGRYRPDWGDGVLVMEDRNGQPHEVTGEELGGLLGEYDTTRLAVLNACEGARSGASDPFAGMAQSLIQQGLPAVVAMQFEITDEAAIIFAHELYGAIADGYPLEAALAEARGAIRDEGNPTEWGTPVLYSRSPDGRLFDLPRQAAIPEADRQAREDEATRKAQEEAARQEAERKGQETAARQEAELKAQETAARQEAERKAQETAARQEAERKAQDEAARQDAERKAQDEAVGHGAGVANRLEELATKRVKHLLGTAPLLSRLADLILPDEVLVDLAWANQVQVTADVTDYVGYQGLLAVTGRRLVFAVGQLVFFTKPPGQAEYSTVSRRHLRVSRELQHIATFAKAYVLIGQVTVREYEVTHTLRIRERLQPPTPAAKVTLALKNGGKIEFSLEHTNAREEAYKIAGYIKNHLL